MCMYNVHMCTAVHKTLDDLQNESYIVSFNVSFHLF